MWTGSDCVATKENQQQRDATQDEKGLSILTE